MRCNIVPRKVGTNIIRSENSDDTQYVHVPCKVENSPVALQIRTSQSLMICSV